MHVSNADVRSASDVPLGSDLRLRVQRAGTELRVLRHVRARLGHLPVVAAGREEHEPSHSAGGRRVENRSSVAARCVSCASSGARWQAGSPTIAARWTTTPDALQSRRHGCRIANVAPDEFERGMSPGAGSDPCPWIETRPRTLTPVAAGSRSSWTRTEAEVTGATGHEDVLGPDRLRLGRRSPHMQDDIGVGSSLREAAPDRRVRLRTGGGRRRQRPVLGMVGERVGVDALALARRTRRSGLPAGSACRTGAVPVEKLRLGRETRAPSLGRAMCLAEPDRDSVHRVDHVARSPCRAERVACAFMIAATSVNG